MASNIVGYLKPVGYNGEKFTRSLLPKKRIAHWSFKGAEPLRAETNTFDKPMRTVDALSGKAFVDVEFAAGTEGRAIDFGAKEAFAA